MLALICSVDLEARPVESVLEAARDRVVGRKRAVEGILAGREVLLLAAGMGKTNAAQGLTAVLESESFSGVIGFGVGGAYPGWGLEPGGLALATREIYGDEGVAAPEGWLSTRDIGIPLLGSDESAMYNVFALDDRRVARAAAALERGGLSAVVGPFVTVSTCSGTLARGAELAALYGAVCESMEGAAYAHVAAVYGVPFLAVRGISNRVEDRNLGGWDLTAASSVAARAVRALVEHFE